jgi:hypothetical protein
MNDGKYGFEKKGEKGIQKVLNEILKSISLLVETSRLGAEESARKAKPYASLYIKGLLSVAAIGIVIPLPFVVIGIIGDWRWMIALAGIWWAVWTLLLLLMASPIGILVEILTGSLKGSGQRYIKPVSSLFLVLLCISLYGAIVPIKEDVSKLPFVIVASIILGILNTWIFSRKVISFIVTVVFIILTLSFYFPTTFHTLLYKISDIDVSSSELQRLHITDESIKKGEVKFFRSDGNPRVWYYQCPDGEMEFYDRSGRHPINNIKLKPVTPEIVRLYQKRFQEKREQMSRQRIQEEAERKAEEARRKKQAKQEFEKFISQVKLADEWKVKNVWKRNIKGKHIVVNYTETTKLVAARIVRRFQKLEARVDCKLVSDVSAASHAGNLYYSFDDLDTVTAIQASVVDILRISLNSIGISGNITLWIG